MINAIRSEWIKLRTARGNIVLAGLALGIPLVFSGLLAMFGDFEFEDERSLFTGMVTGPGFVTVFLCGVLGVLGIGQEYRHSTIRATFSAMPRRSTVLGAKVILTTLFGMGMAIVSQLLCFGVAKTILSSRDVDLDLSFTNPGVNLSASIGHVVLCGLFTVLGFGVGAILRQPAAAIPALLIWTLIVENIIGGLLSLATDSARKWLPVQQGLGLSDNSSGFDDLALSRIGAGLYFGLFTVLLVAIGWWFVERRDA